MMLSIRFLSVGRLPLDVRDVHPFETEKNVLTRASLSSPAIHKSKVPLLSLTRVSLPYAPVTLQSFSAICTPVLVLVSVKKQILAAGRSTGRTIKILPNRILLFPRI